MADYEDILGDHCKFCSNYMDPIGCDCKKAVNGGTWCGQCREGRDALFGAWDVHELASLKQVVQAEYDRDPINWDARAPIAEKPEERVKRLRAHWRRLWLSDLASNLTQVISERG
jgi:hypothetical protein